MAAAADGGIKQLLRAEEEAQAIIAKARQDRVALLKRAEDEAAKEVAAYRALREQQYQSNIGKNAGNKGEYTARLDEQTNQQISAMRAQVSGNAQRVVELLLSSVTDTHID